MRCTKTYNSVSDRISFNHRRDLRISRFLQVPELCKSRVLVVGMGAVILYAEYAGFPKLWRGSSFLCPPRKSTRPPLRLGEHSLYRSSTFHAPNVDPFMLLSLAKPNIGRDAFPPGNDGQYSTLLCFDLYIGPQQSHTSHQRVYVSASSTRTNLER